MVDEPIHDDSSYYEISITAGQAFLAFVLLIGSLAAAFAFGIVVGEARGKTTVAQRARPPVILEGDSSEPGRIVELGVEEEPDEPAPTEPEIEEPVLVEEPAATAPPELSTPGPSSAPRTDEPAQNVPHVAQILSTTEQAPAEQLAARLIEAGFSNAYVERIPGESGTLYRVRVRFPSEGAARGAVKQLEAYAPGEIWISRAEP